MINSTRHLAISRPISRSFRLGRSDFVSTRSAVDLSPLLQPVFRLRSSVEFESGHCNKYTHEPLTSYGITLLVTVLQAQL